MAPLRPQAPSQKAPQRERMGAPWFAPLNLRVWPALSLPGAARRWVSKHHSPACLLLCSLSEVKAKTQEEWLGAEGGN